MPSWPRRDFCDLCPPAIPRPPVQHRDKVICQTLFFVLFCFLFCFCFSPGGTTTCRPWASDWFDYVLIFFGLLLFCLTKWCSSPLMAVWSWSLFVVCVCVCVCVCVWTWVIEDRCILRRAVCGNRRRVRLSGWRRAVEVRRQLLAAAAAAKRLVFAVVVFTTCLSPIGYGRASFYKCPL